MNTMPDCTVIPVLRYPDVAQAIQWLCDTFGFKERWRIADHRAQLEYDGGVVVVAELTGKNTGNDHSVLLRVKDVHAHCEHARAKGAEILQEPTDHFYGERQYAAKDIGGHSWTFSQTIKILSPEDWGATSNNL
ncbi:MAG TPA: VOC family protein [Chitinophagaceae bacterium]|nr:VOC family protein [Chitinophagaceae bacterium]